MSAKMYRAPHLEVPIDFFKVMIPKYIKIEVSDGVEILNGLLTNDPLFCLQEVIVPFESGRLDFLACTLECFVKFFRRDF